MIASTSRPHTHRKILNAHPMIPHTRNGTRKRNPRKKGPQKNGPLEKKPEKMVPGKILPDSSEKLGFIEKKIESDKNCHLYVNGQRTKRHLLFSPYVFCSKHPVQHDLKSKTRRNEINTRSFKKQ